MNITKSLKCLVKRKGINNLKPLLRTILQLYRRMILIFTVNRLKAPNFKKTSLLKLNIGIAMLNLDFGTCLIQYGGEHI